MAERDLQTCLTAAWRAHEAGDADDARRQFEAALAIDASDAGALNWLGADALARDEPKAAADHFTAACASEPAERSHWINLATARRLLGDSAGERTALDGALAIDRTDLLALVRLAELNERLGETRAAAEGWSAVLALAAQIAEPSAEFAAILRHARGFVGDQQRRLTQSIEAALAPALGESSERDRRRMRAAADAWLGKRRIFVNQCEGLHYPFLPADEYFDRALFPWLDQLEAATATIQAELAAILGDPAAELTPYIALPPGVPANKWSPLDRSLEWGAFHLWKEGHRFDDACARAPLTAAIVEALPICRIAGRAPNVFFSILKAGGHIPAHSGVTNVRSVVHLPLRVPGECSFRVGGETRDWVEGQAFAFDDTIEHEAWNRSGSDRAVLIIDAWNPHLSEQERAMIGALYDAADR